MKLTELSKKENISEIYSAHGIIADEFIVNLPYHFNEIGLLAEKEDTGELSYELLDVALAFITNGVDVILEVPYDFDMPAKDILLSALNCGMSVSILAPLSDNEADYTKYTETLCQFTELWLAQTNAVKMLYPSVGFLQYMINEVFDFKTPEISTDEYIINNFVKHISVEKMDEIKDDLRLSIYKSFGGKEEFESYAHTLASSLSDTLINKAS